MEKHLKLIHMGWDKVEAGVLGTGRSREIYRVIALSAFPLVERAWNGSIFSSHVR